MVDSGKCQRYNYYNDKENLAHYNMVILLASIYANQFAWLATVGLFINKANEIFKC